ncbi:MAG: polyphenol oxidase family protein [Actinomycetota bacterium]|nr:polyphenol oxidase family protein [Actinomycetota bacterium]
MDDASREALVPRYRFTGRAEGDLAPGALGVDERRHALAPMPWTWLHQVHGAEVVVVDEPGAYVGARGDAAVTTTTGAVLCVTVADCAPVALLGDGAVGVVHAGWRGLVAGVLGAAVEALARLGAGPLRAVVGPCIGPSCYEFGADDLETLQSVLGPDVAARSREGRPALDLVAGVRSGLAAAGVEQCEALGVCTACSQEHWSHRRSATTCRQALVARVGP